MKIYEGNRAKWRNVVWVKDTDSDLSRPLDPKPSQKSWNHSPDGFEWGYGGSGPAQLALAILLDLGIENILAQRLHQDFKWEFIANALREGFVIREDSIRKWFNENPRLEELTRYAQEMKELDDY